MRSGEDMCAKEMQIGEVRIRKVELRKRVSEMEMMLGNRSCKSNGKMMTNEYLSHAQMSCLTINST